MVVGKFEEAYTPTPYPWILERPTAHRAAKPRRIVVLQHSVAPLAALSASSRNTGGTDAPQLPQRSGSHSRLATKHGQPPVEQPPRLQLHPWYRDLQSGGHAQYFSHK